MADAPKTSWADETEDLAPTPAPKLTENLWAKKNPFNLVAPTAEPEIPEPREERERDRRPPADYRQERDHSREPYAPRDRDRRDFPRNDRERDFPRDRRDNREFRPERENRDYRDQRDQPREYRDHPRENNFRDQPRDRQRESGRRDESKPLVWPTSPPFTAFVGNLPFDVYPEDIDKFFSSKDCQVAGIRIPKGYPDNRPKGYGYVEFTDLESLKRAIECNGESLMDRPLKIDIASAREKPEGRYSRDHGRDFGRDFGRDRPPREGIPSSPIYEAPGSPSETSERRKLELKPRSSPSPIEPTPANYKSAKSNPFGDARPRDENAILKKKEEERKQRELATSETKQENKETTQKEEEKPRQELPKQEKPREERPREERYREERPREENRYREDRKVDRPQEWKRDERRDEREDRVPRDRKFQDERRGGRGGKFGQSYPRSHDRRDNQRDIQRDTKNGQSKDKVPKPVDKPAFIQKETEVRNSNLFAALGETEE